MPDADGDSRWHRVGVDTPWHPAGEPVVKLPVTRITVQRDLPGPGCYLWRVCVWSGESMIAEMPLHNVAAVGYAP